jgi:putative oxidoreductase
MNLAIFIGRLFLGLSLAAHGSQKLFGWFGGPGLKGASGFMKSLGFRPGRPWAICLALTETLAGLFTALGLWFPYTPICIIPVMVVAALTVHKENGFFAQDGGVELTVSYTVTAIMLALLGPGMLSLDQIFGYSETGPIVTWLMVTAGFLAAIVPLALRKPEQS